MRVLSYALVSRNWYKTVSNSYENLYIIEMLYKNSRFKHVHNQSENDNIPEKPVKRKFASVIELDNFSF